MQLAFPLMTNCANEAYASTAQTNNERDTALSSSKGIMSVCTNNKGEREREHHEWRQLLLSYARQPEGHYLALIAAQPPPFVCFKARRLCSNKCQIKPN